MRVIPIAGLVEGRVDPRDRGLAYGDGLYETMRWSNGRIPLLERHLARLVGAAARLGLPLPERGVLERAVAGAGVDLADAAVKLVVTRGVGPRGYAPPQPASATAFALVAAWTPPASRGLVLRRCELTLAPQPALAGLKHLNRLEQVLARAEWDDPAIDEGLLCDPSGHVVCATAANLFAVIDRRLVTPDLSRAGVAGVARAIVCEALDVEVRALPFAALERASEVFLTNALRGVMPVARIGAWRYAPGPATRAAAAALARAGLPQDAVR